MIRAFPLFRHLPLHFADASEPGTSSVWQPPSPWADPEPYFGCGQLPFWGRQPLILKPHSDRFTKKRKTANTGAGPLFISKKESASNGTPCCLLWLPSSLPDFFYPVFRAIVFPAAFKPHSISPHITQASLWSFWSFLSFREESNAFPNSPKSSSRL